MRFMQLAKLAVIGLALCGFQAGCGDSKPKSKPTAGGGHADHDHGAKGPNGGSIVETNYKDYHLELVLNHNEKKVTVYVLGSDMKTPATIKPEGDFSMNVSKPSVANITLKAVDEKDGAAAKFTGENDMFANEPPFEGSFSAMLDGKPYSFKFKIEEHDEGEQKKEGGKEEKPQK